MAVSPGSALNLLIEPIQVFYENGNSGAILKAGDSRVELELGEFDAEEIFAAFSIDMLHNAGARQLNPLRAHLDRGADADPFRRFDAQSGFGDVDALCERKSRLSVIVPRDAYRTHIGNAPMAAYIFVGRHQ